MRVFRVLPKCMKDSKLSSDESLFELKTSAIQEQRDALEIWDTETDIIPLDIPDDKLYYLGCHPADGPIYCLKEGVTL